MRLVLEHEDGREIHVWDLDGAELVRDSEKFEEGPDRMVEQWLLTYVKEANDEGVRVHGTQ